MHLHKSFFPLLRTRGLSGCVGVVQGRGKLNSTRGKAWDFSDEEIASLRRSPVTGSWVGYRGGFYVRGGGGWGPGSSPGKIFRFKVAKPPKI